MQIVHICIHNVDMNTSRKYLYLRKRRSKRGTDDTANMDGPSWFTHPSSIFRVMKAKRLQSTEHEAMAAVMRTVQRTLEGKTWTVVTWKTWECWVSSSKMYVMKVSCDVNNITLTRDRVQKRGFVLAEFNLRTLFPLHLLNDIKKLNLKDRWECLYVFCWKSRNNLRIRLNFSITISIKHY